jgi:hypothetical protein
MSPAFHGAIAPRRGSTPRARVLRAGVLLALCAWAATTSVPEVRAQARDDGFKVTELQLAPLAAPRVGRLAMAEGRLAANEHHFTLSNLSIFQPVAVVAVADDPAHPVTLRLGKFDWKEDFKGGTTGRDGRVIASFRTQGDLLVTVGATDAAGYSLAVWAGDEAPPPMDALLVPAGAGDGGGWRAHKLLLAFVGGVLVLALGWLAGRRNRKEGA